MKKNYKTYILIFLIAFSFINLYKFYPKLISNDGKGLDLRTYMASSKSYFKYGYIYSDSFQENIVKEMEKKEIYSINRKAGFPNAVAVYAPQFVWMFYPFTFLKFKIAFIVFTILSLLSIVFSAFFVSKLNHHISFPIILTFLFALKPTWYGLINGQPIFLASFFIIFSLYLFQKKQKLLSAFIFSLSLFKPTLAVPFILFYFLKKEWKWLLSVVIIGMIFNFSIILNSYLLVNFNSWKYNINSLFEYTMPYQQTNHLSINSTSFLVFIAYFIKVNLNVIKLLPFVTLLLLLILINKKLEKNYFFLSLIALCWLVFSHFLIYDLYFLMLILLLANYYQKYSSELFIIVMTFLPIGIISDAFNLPYLNLYLPLILLIIFLDKIWFRKLFRS